MKKAFEHLTQQGVAYEFFDYKKQTLSFEDFKRFVAIFGVDKVINKQGTTYRNFDEQTRAVLAGDDMTKIYDIIKNHQSVIKRPIVLGTHKEQAIAVVGVGDDFVRTLS